MKLNSKPIQLMLPVWLVLSSHAVVGQQLFEAHLSGGSRIPAAHTRGSGDVAASLNGDTLTFYGSFGRLSGDLTRARVHLGYAGQDGASVLDLTAELDASKRSGTFSETQNGFVLSAAELTALADRRLYINLETTEFPNGEVRGQILPRAERYFESVMSGGESVPSAITTAWGSVVAELRDSVVTISGSFGSLSTPARVDFLNGTHIHFTRFADSGNNIRFVLNVEYDADLKGGVIRPDSNTFRLNAWQYGLLLDRQWYADVHSLKWRLSEIRGTLHPMSDLYFVGRMTGHNVVPSNESGASVGIVGGLLGDTLTLSGTFLPMQGNVDSLGDSPAHVHRAPPAEVGPIEFPLGITLQRQNHGHFVPRKNTFVLNDEQVETLLNGGFYADVHSSVYPMTGEVRGQILVAGNSPAPRPTTISPPPGTELYVRPDDPKALSASWSRSTDPDGDQVVYVWQLGQNERMSADSLLVSRSVGGATSVSLTGAYLDSLLGSVGIKYLQTRTLYHRLVTSDGAANDRAPAQKLQVTRTSITELPQGSTSAAQIDEGVLADLDRAISSGEFDEVHGLLVIRDGTIVHESYFRGNQDYFDDQLNRVSPGDTLWDATLPHYVAGVTRAVTSAVVGIALDQYGVDVDTPLYEILPQYSNEFTGTERDITIRDLLTMTSGYAWEEPSDLERMWQFSVDFAEYVLGGDHVTPPGSVWRYNQGAVNVLMAIVGTLSGNAAEYIRQQLFVPLDITEYEWRLQPGGLPEAGLSLFMRPRDLAKIAYVYLNEGIWNNEVIIPPDWVRESLSTQVTASIETGADFGYLWWVREIEFVQNGATRALKYFAAEGDGGNVVTVFPRLDMSVIITQGNYGSEDLARTQIDRILGEFILPATDLRNKLPIVTMETPKDGDRPVTTQPLVIRAMASDPDGRILKVDFLQDSLLIATDSLPPFEMQIDSAFSGCYTIVARATDDFGGVGSQFSRIKMGEGCLPGPYGIVPFSVPGVIEAENYDVGGPEVSYHDNDRAENSGGAYRPLEGVDIRGEPGNYYVIDTENGEWLQYFLDVESSGDYDVISRTASGQEPGIVRLWVDSLIFTDPVDLTEFPADGSWRDTKVAQLKLTEGFHRVRVIIDKGGFYLDNLRFAESSVAASWESDGEESLPTAPQLQIYPNPASTSARVWLALPESGRPDLEIFDVVGRSVGRLIDRPLGPGRHEVLLDAGRLSSGVYLLRLKIAQHVLTTTLIVRH